MEWMGLIVTAGVVTVLICAGIFELLERRKRAAFQQQVHDLAQKYIKEKQKWYNEEAIQCELNNMGTIKLVKCWIRNVWPLPQLHSLRSRLSHLH